MKNGDFCEELLDENDFEAVLTTFCYGHGAKACEAFQKITPFFYEQSKILTIAPKISNLLNNF